MRTCKWCGAEIAADRTAEYCGTRCYQAAWRKAKRAEAKPLPQTKPCRMCGKEFIPNQNNRLYCAPACRVKHDALKAEQLKRITRPPDLDRTLRELDAYNRTHGTLITYGQWMGGVRV